MTASILSKSLKAVRQWNSTLQESTELKPPGICTRQDSSLTIKSNTFPRRKPGEYVSNPTTLAKTLRDIPWLEMQLAYKKARKDII